MTSRHDHQWPHPRLAVGSGVWTREQVLGLKAEGVTHVLDCRKPAPLQEWYAGTGVQVFHCATEDDGERKGAEWFEWGVQAACSILGRPDTRLLVHCAGGVNRGPSMAYAVLRVCFGMEPGEAWRAIKAVRPFALMSYAGDADRWITDRQV